MWGKDDEIRSLPGDFALVLEDQASNCERKPSAIKLGEKLIRAVEELIYKEENIPFPLCPDMLSEEEWAEIWSASPGYGWCLVEPRKGFTPPTPRLPGAAHLPEPEGIELPTGHLSLEQLIALFSTLPVDITFVDAEDRVAFYSGGRDRIFARSKAVIGRKVQRCHPPRSVHVVERILGDFRKWRRSVAGFWIQFRGRFVHIRYFAVRGQDNRYLRTLEVTQDLTEIRTPEGERRLLEYETVGTAAERIE